jgi:type II secretion system protein D
MKTTWIHSLKTRPAAVVALLCLLLTGALPGHALAQVLRITGMPDIPGITAAPPPPSSSKPDSGGGKDGGGPWLPAEAPAITSTNLDGAKTNTVDEIQLSFQGANIDMVVQWLAQTTGKTVVKHPRVQCQLTITSSKKVSQRQAIVLVYRALAMEGFSAIESAQSILIVPEGQEPRMSPELVTGSSKDVPEGRQRLVKVFTLKNIQASDLKERIRIALTDKALIDVDERANQIILTDYNDNIRIAGDLIAALDTDKPEDVAVRMLPLKSVAAMQIAREIGPLYQKMSGKSLDVAADERANALIILSSQSSYDAIQKLVASLDTEDAQEKSSETIILKNADAQDVAKQLQDLNQSQTQSQPRYFYSYSSSDMPAAAKKFSVVADRRRNAIIVQAPPAQMANIKKMVAELDAPVADDSLAPRIYPLKYVSAVDIEEVLNELFLKKQQQRSYLDYIFSDELPSSSTPDRDVGRLYGKVRITSEPHANALIVTSNSKENLSVIEDVLRQLDTPSEVGESTLRINLRFARAATVANNLNILFAKNGSPALRPGPNQNQNDSAALALQRQQQPFSTATAGFNLEQETREEGYYPWLGGQPDNVRSGDGKTAARVSDLVGRVRIVADHRGNAVIVSANVHFLPQILKLINDLDAASDQVSIEARIVEVGTDYLDKLGVRWSPDGSKVFSTEDYDNSVLIHGRSDYVQGYGGKTEVNSPQNNAVLQTLTTLRSGMVSGSISMDFLVQFLKKNTDATVLGEPQITINDNETGKLFVGQQVPIPQNTQISSVGSQNTAITYKDVGVVLEVTPHINTAGDVHLKIHAESSTVVPGQTVLGGAVFDTRNFRTDLTSKDGQTLVVGGIIQRQLSNIDRKTPILGDIPVLGWAFKKKDKSTRQVELMVFLRTKVVRTPAEMEGLLQDVGRKAPQLKKWQEENLPETPK